MSSRSLFLLALGLRVLLWAVPLEFAHHQHYAQDAVIIRAGGNLYAEQAYYNYTPLWGWLLAALPFPAPFGARVAVTAADLLIGVLLLRLRGRLAAAVYLLCPLTILNGGWIAQFEPLGITCLLCAVSGAAAQTQLPVHHVGVPRPRVPLAPRVPAYDGVRRAVYVVVHALSTRRLTRNHG